MTLLVVESELTPLCRRNAIAHRVWDGTDAELEAHEVVMMGPDWAQLRAWRAEGHRFGALIVLEGAAPPKHRAGLEPLALFEHGESLPDTLGQLQRGSPSSQLHLALGPLDLETRVLTTEDGPVRLSQREADLLAYLASRPHRDVGRDELQTQVWGHKKAALDTRSVDMAVARLRKKIEPDPSQPRHLLTSRGGGYRLNLTVAAAHNLSVPPNRLIGRVHELASLGALVEGNARLVTLVGPPGAGKTRLALELAHRLAQAGAHPGGTWFCDLVPTRTTADVVVALASALSLSLVDEPRPLDRIAESLGRRGRTLLFLDNAEHVVDALLPVLTACLASAPELQILLTSQTRLSLAAEHVHDLGTLPHEDAVVLFLERTEAAGSTLQRTESLDRLLTQLDHLPLALELAARRLRTLTVDDLLAHLAERWSWLDRGPVDAPVRHQALSTALRWAWDLLDLSDRKTLAALACFRGSFSAASAATVLEISVIAIGEQLETLLDRSLLVRRESSFGLLESVRAFALDAAEPEWLEHYRGTHAQALVELAERWGAGVGGPHAREAVAELTSRVGDLTAAWETLREGTLDDWSTVTLALNAVHRVHGGTPQREAVIQPVLARATEQKNPAIEARLAAAWGRVHRQGPAYDVAVRELSRAANLYQELGQSHRAANALVDVAYVEAQRHGEAPAFAALDRALALQANHALAETLRLHLVQKWVQPIERGQAERMHQNVERLAARGSLYRSVSAALLLAQTYTHLGCYDEVTTLRQEALERARLLPDRSLEATLLCELAMEASFSGAYAYALGLMDEVMRLNRDCGDRPSIEKALLYGATIALHQGDHDRCRSHLAEHLESIQPLGDRYREIFARIVQICLHLDRGELGEAQRWLAHLAILTEERNTPLVRTSHLQLLALHQLLDGRAEAANETLRAAHYPGASPSNVAQTMAMQGVAADLLDRPQEREARGRAMLEALAQTRVPSREEWVALGEALATGEPTALRVLRDGPSHGVLRLTLKAWLGTGDKAADETEQMKHNEQSDE